jgi:hypothetical protein
MEGPVFLNDGCTLAEASIRFMGIRYIPRVLGWFGSSYIVVVSIIDFNRLARRAMCVAGSNMFFLLFSPHLSNVSGRAAACCITQRV